MLFDPKWEAQTKADPLSLRSVVTWLEKMPANEAYDYDDCKGNCLYGLYMASHGVEWEKSGACSSLDGGKERSNFCEVVYALVAVERPWTFGAALERARKAADRPS